MKEILLYDDIFDVNVKLMNMILKEYGNNEKAWRILYEFYIDPDSYPIENGKYKMVGDVKCTADGLLSINRIKQHEQCLGDDFIAVYKKYRNIPIMFFPSERNGINSSRNNVFGDRIDHTLFDLKRKCEGKEDCKLEKAYNLSKTTNWLNKFKRDFGEIVKWLGIEGIFVVCENKEWKVYDLEYNDGTIIENYCDSYSKKWSNRYYINVKAKIEEYKKQLVNSDMN